MGSFCYKTTGTWVRWNSALGVISFPPNSLYSSLNLGCSLCLLNNPGSQPRWNPNTITFLLSGMEMLRCSQSLRCSVVSVATGGSSVLICIPRSEVLALAKPGCQQALTNRTTVMWPQLRGSSASRSVL